MTDTRRFEVSFPDLLRAYETARVADIATVDAMWMILTMDCPRAERDAAVAAALQGVADTVNRRALDHTKNLPSGSDRADSREAWTRAQECRVILDIICAIAIQTKGGG